MKLHPVTRTDTNSKDACGPAAIACITGMGTQAARDSLRQAYREDLGQEGKRIVLGVSMEAIKRTIELYSMKHSLIVRASWQTDWTVAQLLHRYKPTEGNLFLIHCARNQQTSHVIVCDRNKIVDNHRPNGVDYWEHPYINTIVYSIYEISDVTCEDL